MTILTGGTPVNGQPTSQSVTRSITTVRDENGKEVVVSDVITRAANGPDACKDGC